MRPKPTLDVRTPTGQKRPTFRRISLLPSKWEASIEIEHRAMAGYGKSQGDAVKDLQKQIDKAFPRKGGKP